MLQHPQEFIRFRRDCSAISTAESCGPCRRHPRIPTRPSALRAWHYNWSWLTQIRKPLLLWCPNSKYLTACIPTEDILSCLELCSPHPRSDPENTLGDYWNAATRWNKTLEAGRHGQQCLGMPRFLTSHRPEPSGTSKTLVESWTWMSHIWGRKLASKSTRSA